MFETIIHQSSWATTRKGTPIELYRKSHKNDSISPYLFIGGVHGDEPEGVRLAKEFLNWLGDVEKTQKEQIHPWLLIPCINPDGYAANQRTNSQGVDLNRNFPSPDWSPEFQKDRYFPGPKAASEKETQALVQLIETAKPKAIFHFHSWEPCLVYTGHSGEPYARVLSVGNSYPVREDIGYPTPGSLGQYGWLCHKIPVICVEEQEKIDLELVWPHFSKGFEKLMKRV